MVLHKTFTFSQKQDQVWSVPHQIIWFGCIIDPRGCVLASLYSAGTFLFCIFLIVSAEERTFIFLQAETAAC